MAKLSMSIGALTAEVEIGDAEADAERERVREARRAMRFTQQGGEGE